MGGAPRIRRVAAAALVALAAAASAAEPWADARHGAYLAKAAGCVACHTAEEKSAVPYAGGRALKTPFGVFYGPNITPDDETGIGRWSEADFMRAMRDGVRPDGAPLYPAFPYPSFTRMTDRDMRDLWAYLRTLPPARQANRAHELRFPLGMRFLVTVWKRLYFTPGAFSPPPNVEPAIARGAYLVSAISHCGECHTPRNIAGAPRVDRFLAGGKGPDGKNVPNLTPTRLKSWSDEDLREFFTTGLTPDGDAAAGAMAEVIRNSTSQLAVDDLAALVAYLRSLPALPDESR
jgi:mono/diheme cytochrome c family protein